MSFDFKREIFLWKYSTHRFLHFDKEQNVKVSWSNSMCMMLSTKEEHLSADSILKKGRPYHAA
jgi:hypothetical protein